jgi:hypothetical protein
MEGGWLVRLRWRRRGAWLWHAFVALTAVDALIGHSLPAAGDTASLAGATILALFVNLIAVVLLSRPLGALIRRTRKDLPGIVARDIGGRVALTAVAAVFLIAGIAHHPSIGQQQRVLEDAIVRAQSFIGDRAPGEFRRNVEHVSTVAIEPGRVYRMCVPSADGRRNYCVIVKTGLPFASSVSFGGYESNAVFAAGTN